MATLLTDGELSLGAIVFQQELQAVSKTRHKQLMTDMRDVG